jgi:thioredoxin-like negative regulator of GroEL
MHVPTVTDEMLEKVVEAAASPVFLVFFEAASAGCARLRRRVEGVADEFDDRVIFLAINADENPSPAKAHGLDELPSILILKRGREVGRAVGDIARESIEELLERAITVDG